ncbi:MAG: class I SAM-dependent methyltransferase [Chromatiales bacterium]|nr:class I SAM-dependent methyltransferase [Chromatiales bacterium]
MDRTNSIIDPPVLEEHWRRRFTERGRLFDDDAAIAGWSDSGLETRLRNFKHVWKGDCPGARWLDAGCGAGSYSRYLISRGLKVIGIDYSLPSVQKARVRGPMTSNWVVADVRRLPFASHSMNGVMCFGVMQTLTCPDQALDELIRVTALDGQIWIDALNADFLPTRLKRLKAWLTRRDLSLRYDRPAQLSSSLEKIGARNIRLYWVPILPARLRRFQKWVETPLAQWVIDLWPPLAKLVSHAFVLSAQSGSQNAGPIK